MRGVRSTIRHSHLNFMKKILSSILICVFSLWLLPVAALVAPSQDKLVCDGQRAICLCRHQPSAKSLQPSSGSRQASGMDAVQSGQSQTIKESGGMAPQFLTRHLLQGVPARGEVLPLPEDPFLYSFRFIPASESVPRSA